VTISVSAGVSGSASITSAPGTTATGTATATTKGGIGGVVSSVLAGVTGKSDASKILARQGSVTDTVFSGRSLIAVILGLLAF
jgi:hypothetical protein